jgi:lysophospholipase L1-like esterase
MQYSKPKGFQIKPMKKTIDAAKIDANMAIKAARNDNLQWWNPAAAPLRLTGFYWYDRDRVFRRLPNDETRMPKVADGASWHASGAALLSWHTAGGQVQFRSDSSRIVLKVKLLNDNLMDHMPQTGSSGFDVYCAELGEFRFVGVTRFELKTREYTAEPVKDMPRAMREFLIDFPLYNGVESLEIGLDADAELAPPTPWRDDRPIVGYGTSILHGGCASRPGMSYPNLLSRHLNQPVLNFGFSGSGKGEPEVAAMLAEIENPAVYLLDYEANTGTVEHMAKTLPSFIDILRARHPEVPILVISGIMYGRDAVPSGIENRAEKRRRYIETERDEVERRRRAGDRRIHFLDGSRLLGEDWDECTVDGVHPNDLGFYRMAAALQPEIEKVIGGVN